MQITRRAALLGLTSAITLGRASLAMATGPAALPQGQRLVVVILRGAMDGLAVVVPYGDPNLATWRAELTPPAPGREGGLLDLGGFYGLHPALAQVHAMYAAGEVLPIHAVAGPYRSRSHFEAQDFLESGADHRMSSGWLNRVVGVLPASEGGASPGGPAIAIGGGMPLLLRGPATVGSWAPSKLVEPAPDLYARVAALTRDDALIGPAIAEGLRERGFTDAVVAGSDEPKAGDRAAFPVLAGFAGRMLAAADGPRIAALELGGWDTHARQVPRLTGALRQLDQGLAALRSNLGDAWRQTAVLVVTEFGRTVRANGTSGTDHGTGTVAFALGGAVVGGKVRADWPGLAQAKLLEDRDLQPTAELRSIAKGLLTEHLRLSGQALAQVFPDSAAAPPSSGLIRAAVDRLPAPSAGRT